MADRWRDTELNLGDRLRRCRQQIDCVDGAIAALLRERARLALSAGRLKLAAGQPLTAPEREMAVLARVKELGGAPLEADRLVRIFRTIIEETRATENQWLKRQEERPNDDTR